MFGDNPIRENEAHLDGASLAVQDIFYTLQGEGPQAGRAAVFVRLAGCNLACTFCDTDFESKIDNRLTLNQIMHVVCSMKNKAQLLVLTGGEPLRQNVLPLIEACLGAGFELVQIETAGTLWQEGLEDWADGTSPKVQIVCSPKTPRVHPRLPLFCDHYKYIIEAGRISREDGLPTWGTQASTEKMPQKLYRPSHGGTIWVSPCDPGAGNGANGMTSDQIHQKNIRAATGSALSYGYRLSLQMHKLVGLP